MEPNKKNYYVEIKKLLKTRKITLRIIVAPPRSASTLLENLFAAGTKSTKIHEPFLYFGHWEKEEDKILKTVYNQIKKNEEKDVILKEMSQSIYEKAIYKKLFDLTEFPILFAIRSPLLCVESKIRVVLKSTEVKKRYMTQRFLLNFYAKENGEKSWAALEKKPANSKKMNFLSKIKDPYNTPNLKLQKKLLDYYTSKKGYKNWEKMINYATNHQDYRHFEDLIKGIGKRVSTNEFGWNQLKEEIDYCKKKKDFAILDTEELRKNPEKTLKKITKIWKFKFKKNILTWKKGEFYEISKKKQRNRPYLVRIFNEQQSNNSYKGTYAKS